MSRPEPALTVDRQGFVFIPGGKFVMGSPTFEADRDTDGSEDQREVSVRNFFLCDHNVTQGEWLEVMPHLGTDLEAYDADSEFHEQEDESPDFHQYDGANFPAVYVNLGDIAQYCNRRSQRDGLTPAYAIDATTVTWDLSADGYRLPTEAEWEYACRAGENTRYPCGNELNERDNLREVWLVGKQFRPNAWGLHDLVGQVEQLCWGDLNEYPQGDNPTGPLTRNLDGVHALRGARGFDLDQAKKYYRCAERGYTFPNGVCDTQGFRIARSVPKVSVNWQSGEIRIGVETIGS